MPRDQARQLCYGPALHPLGTFRMQHRSIALSPLRWLALFAALATSAGVAAPRVADAGFQAVDPFIGTGGEGHTYPGATVPFGMVQLSPDTQIKPRKEAYGWAAGYRHSDSTIVGFSHTHFSGSGHSDLGDILLMPQTGEVKLERGDIATPGSGYTAQFDHASEQAQPGYYAVTLKDRNIRAELTASARVGVHRYTFPKGTPAHVLVDLRTSLYDHPGKVQWSRLRLAQRWHRHRLSRNARLGAGSAVVFRHAFFAPAHRHAIA